MGLLAGNANYETTRVSGLKLSKALLGTPLRVIFGQHRSAWDVIWYGDFSSKKVNQGGSGGKGGAQYTYTASIIGAICQGPTNGLRTVWDNSGKFIVSTVTENYTVPSSTPYKVQVLNAYADIAKTNLVFVADNGVSNIQSITPTPKPIYNPSTAYYIIGFAISSNIVTFFYGSTIAGHPIPPPPSIGAQLNITGMRAGTYLNGQTLTVASSSSGSFTCNFTHATNVTRTRDFGLATPIVTPSPTPTPVPMTQVTGSPTQGQYSYDPTTGTYTFNAADAGASIQIGYSFNRYTEIAEELQEVPTSSPFQVTVDNQPYFQHDEGVFYYPSGTGLIAVSGTPTVAGTYNPNGGNYRFAAADAGKGITINYSWKNPNTEANAPNSLNLTFINGAKGQAPWSYMTSKHQNQALGYTEVAYAASSGLFLGFTPQAPSYNFEVAGVAQFGGGIVDANPADCILYALTDQGAGIGFPSQYIDASLQGLARAWWTANSFFISEVIEGQSSVSEVCGKWLEAGQVGAYYSEGLLKFVPYGDQIAVGNGATYYPPTQPVAAFTDSDFVAEKDKAPLKIERVPWMDAYNKVRARWTVRSNDYNSDVLEESDEGRIQQFGLREEGPQSWEFITTLAAAQFATSMRVQRYSAIKNTYTFRVSDRWAAILEPMDLVSITDSRLGIANVPVRITEIEDDPEHGLSIKAEDFPYGVAQPAAYDKQVNAPSADIVYGHAAPGDTIPTIIEIPSALSKGQGNTLHVLASGGNANWGGCTVWISFNGTDYTPYSKISGASRTGVLTAALAATADPDTTDTLSVQMDAPDANLVGVTQADADAFITLSALYNPTATPPTLELCSYENVTLTGPETYNFTYLRRGLYGTSVRAHSIGEKFARLDNTVLSYQYPVNLVGQTIFFKFTSFNIFNQNEEQLSNVTAYAFTLQGSGPATLVSLVGAWNSIQTYYPSQQVTNNGNTYTCRLQNTNQAPPNATYWQLVGPATLDNVSDGTTYGRPLFVRLNAGKPWIDFSETIHANKNLDNVADGSGRFGVINGGGLKAVSSVDGANKALIDFSQGGHTNKSLNNIPDGSQNFSATASTLTYRPTTNPLTGHDAGATATINVAAFTLRTSSKGDVSDNSGSITALSYKTLYYVYYDDPNLAGGSVTYQVTTTKETAIQGGGRVFIGSIITPAATAPDTTGNNDGGVGAQAGQTSVFLFGAVTGAGVSGQASAVGGALAIDGDLTTHGTLQITGAGSVASGASFTLSGMTPTSAPWSSLTLYVRSAVPSDTINPGTGAASVGYSLDGGSTYTTIYQVGTATTRALTTDSIALPLNMNLANLRVQASVFRNNGFPQVVELDLYEAWVVGLQ